MNTHRTLFVAYVAIVIASGAALLAASWMSPGAFPTKPLVGFAFWLVLSLAAECFWLETPTRAGMISMSLAVNTATIFLLPFAWVVTIGAASVVLTDLLLHRRDIVRAGFNGAQTALSMAATFWVVRVIIGSPHYSGRTILLEHPLAVVCGVVTFFVLNTGLVAGVISLNGRLGLWKAWRDNFGFGYQFLSSGALTVIGLTLVLSTEVIGYLSGMLYLLVFFFIRDAYHRFSREREARLTARTSS
jgi:hypothetical protein